MFLLYLSLITLSPAHMPNSVQHCLWYAQISIHKTDLRWSFCGDLSDSGRKEKECRKKREEAEWLREAGAGWMWRARRTPSSCKLYTVGICRERKPGLVTWRIAEWREFYHPLSARKLMSTITWMMELQEFNLYVNNCLHLLQGWIHWRCNTVFQDRLLSAILFFFPLNINVTLRERFSAGGGDNKQCKGKSG